MSISAAEIEKLEGDKPKRKAMKYTDEYRKEAVEYYMKAHADSGKTITKCAEELGVNAKTLNDWVVRFNNTGKTTQARSEEQAALDKAMKRIKELEAENEFLKKAAAFFASSLQ